VTLVKRAVISVITALAGMAVFLGTMFLADAMGLIAITPRLQPWLAAIGAMCGVFASTWYERRGKED